MINPPVDRCPRCGSDEGYYTKDYLYGRSSFNYNYDGTESDNSGMYDGLNCKSGNIAYCINCGKRLFRLEEATP